jgi:hypothetical protein
MPPIQTKSVGIRSSFLVSPAVSLSTPPPVLMAFGDGLAGLTALAYHEGR